MVGNDEISRHYRTLELNRSATVKEIREAYYRLARLHHPDHNYGDPDAEDRFKKVQVAFEALSKQRALKLPRQYDPLPFKSPSRPRVAYLRPWLAFAAAGVVLAASVWGMVTVWEQNQLHNQLHNGGRHKAMHREQARAAVVPIIEPVIEEAKPSPSHRDVPPTKDSSSAVELPVAALTSFEESVDRSDVAGRDKDRSETDFKSLSAKLSADPNASLRELFGDFSDARLPEVDLLEANVDGQAADQSLPWFPEDTPAPHVKDGEGEDDASPFSWGETSLDRKSRHASRRTPSAGSAGDLARSAFSDPLTPRRTTSRVSLPTEFSPPEPRINKSAWESPLLPKRAFQSAEGRRQAPSEWPIGDDPMFDHRTADANGIPLWSPQPGTQPKVSRSLDGHGLSGQLYPKRTLAVSNDTLEEDPVQWNNGLSGYADDWRTEERITPVLEDSHSWMPRSAGIKSQKGLPPPDSSAAYPRGPYRSNLRNGILTTPQDDPQSVDSWQPLAPRR